MRNVSNTKRFCSSSSEQTADWSVLGILTYVSAGVLTYSTVYLATVSQAYFGLSAKLFTAEGLGIDVGECRRQV